jgi:hypothetical protein
MNQPSTMLHLKFLGADGRHGLWLPFFLIYPILLVISLILLPFLLIAAIIMAFFEISYALVPLKALWLVWNVVFKTRGLTVDVKKNGRDLLIDFV